MFCGNCGSQIPDGGVCPVCNSAAVAAVQPEAPVNTGKRLSKGQYIKELAPTSVKTFSIIGLITTFVCLAFFVTSFFAFKKMDIMKMPIVETAFDVAEDTTASDFDTENEELFDQLDKHSDEIDEAIEKTDLSDEDKNLLIDLKETIQDTENGITIEKLEKIVDSVRIISENDEFAEIEELKDVRETDLDEFDEILALFNLINIVIIVAILFFAVFTILGGFLRINGFVIPGLILSVIFYAILFGALYVSITVLLHVMLIVANAVVKKSYKKYKKSF